MNVHLRIDDNRTFSLKQAVLLYQEGNRAFAMLHEVKCRPNQAPYLCAGQSVTTGFLETLATGLGASMAPEVLPEHVLARTPELIVWWSGSQSRLMFFGDGNSEAKKLNGKMFPHPALVLMIHGRELFARALAEGHRPTATTGFEKRAVLEHRRARSSVSWQYASSGGEERRLPVGLGKRVFRQRIHPSQWRCPTDNSSRRLSWPLVEPCRKEAQVSCEVPGRQQADPSRVRPANSQELMASGTRKWKTPYCGPTKKFDGSRIIRATRMIRGSWG
jgi:hypothetical protein